ncbi:MAG TPA: hypothetical protein V6C78_06715 [Crinalium sp.]|jgi:hypothetical protein
MASLTREKSHPGKSDYAQPDSLVCSTSEETDVWLNASELATVLDMLAVMETREELKILECLTPVQKRQVWDATPYELKVKLHHLKNSTVAPPQPLEHQNLVQSDSFVQVDVQADTCEDDESEEDDLESEEIELRQIEPDDLDISERSPNLATLMVGDRVVLKAKPGLSKAELMAIFDVVEIHSDLVHCRTSEIGGRRYPLDWLIIYPHEAADLAE